MAKRDSNGHWLDSQGHPVPVKYIDPVDKKRDALVEKLFRQALKAQENLRRFKELADADINTYLQWLAEHSGAEALNAGGNYKLTSFHGDLRVQVMVKQIIDWDERLAFAKARIDACVVKWSKAGNDNLNALIYKVLQVDKQGRVDTKGLLSLLSLKIEDKEWQEAMELLKDAIRITGTKSYIMFQQRTAPDGEWQTLRLDLAGV